MKFKFNKSNVLGYVAGCKDMLALFIMAERDRTFKKTLKELIEWHDKVLNPWRYEVEDKPKNMRWDPQNYLPPRPPMKKKRERKLQDKCRIRGVNCRKRKERHKDESKRTAQYKPFSL